MKRKLYKKGLAVMLGLALLAGTPASSLFSTFNSYAYTGTASVKASSLNVRSGAGTSYQAVGRLAAGASVQIVGEQTGSDGKRWYRIQFTGSGGSSSEGYVSADYIRLPVSYTADSSFEAYLNSQGFPESYKEGLRQLHAQYPNWVFQAKNTGLDWNTVIENEAVLGRNLVATGSVSSWKSVETGAYNWDNSTWTGLDGSSWVAASEDIIRYYMDPRNFLDDTYVFQFLAHDYDAGTQTKEGLTHMVEGSFLSGSTGSTGTSSSSAGTGGSAGGSSGSAQVSDYGPGGSAGQQDVNNGPGVAGSSSQKETVTTESGQKVEISLEGPQASIARKEHNLLTSSVTVITGAEAAPGASQSTQSTDAASDTSSGPQANSPSSTQNGSAPQAASPASGGSASYVDILMKAASQSGVSPYVLAAMILQEQGTNGGTNLISGTYSGYEGYYNFFNVEAYQSGSNSPTVMGLRYASQSGSYGRPWNTVEKSILGGAQNYGDNYVKAGQNTFYLKKFNVQGSNLYKHQYMSNVQAAASEAERLSKAYTSDIKSSALVFHIPVYSNMPDTACAAPVGDGSPNNKLSSLSVDGFSLTPTFGKDTESYSLIVDTSVTSVTIRAQAADAKASVSGAGTAELTGSSAELTVTVTAENGSVRSYVIQVVKQAGGPTAGASQSGSASPGASSGSAGAESQAGPGASGGGSPTPGGSSVTIVEVN